MANTEPESMLEEYAWLKISSVSAIREALKLLLNKKITVYTGDECFNGYLKTVGDSLIQLNGIHSEDHIVIISAITAIDYIKSDYGK